MLTFASVSLLLRVKRPLHEMLIVKSSQVILAVLSIAVLLLLLSPSTVGAQSDEGGGTISAVKVSGITPSSVTITWITAEATSSTLLFGTSRDSPSSRIFNPALTFNHGEQLSGLAPNTRYFFQVPEFGDDGEGATDSAGEFYSFSTLSAHEVRRVFVGVVTSRPRDTFRLHQQDTGEIVTIHLPRDIAVTVPPRPGAGGLGLGARVVVLGQLVDGEWEAQRVIVKPWVAALPINGVVVGAEKGILSLTSSDGAIRSVDLSALKGEAKVGDLVTVLPGPSGQARGLVKAAQLRERLRRFLKDIVERVDQAPDFDSKAQRAESLITLLENQLARQEQIFDAVLAQAPAGVKAKIREAKANLQSFGQASEDIRARVKSKFGLTDDKGNSGPSRPQDQTGEDNPQSTGGQGSSQPNPSRRGAPGDIDQGGGQGNPQGNPEGNGGQKDAQNSQNAGNQNESASENTGQSSPNQDSDPNASRPSQSQESSGQGPSRDVPDRGGGKDSGPARTSREDSQDAGKSAKDQQQSGSGASQDNPGQSGGGNNSNQGNKRENSQGASSDKGSSQDNPGQSGGGNNSNQGNKQENSQGADSDKGSSQENPGQSAGGNNSNQGKKQENSQGANSDKGSSQENPGQGRGQG